MNALQEARRQTGINFADILYFDGEHLCRISATVFWYAEQSPQFCKHGPGYSTLVRHMVHRLPHMLRSSAN